MKRVHLKMPPNVHANVVTLPQTTPCTYLQPCTPPIATYITASLPPTKTILIFERSRNPLLRPFVVLCPPLAMVSLNLPRRPRSRIDQGRSLLVEDLISLLTVKLDVLRTAAAPEIALGFVVGLIFPVEKAVAKVSDTAAEGAWLA